MENYESAIDDLRDAFANYASELTPADFDDLLEEFNIEEDEIDPEDYDGFTKILRQLVDNWIADDVYQPN
jgi:hypothetical protein